MENLNGKYHIFRRQFARTISSRIFNDTRNLLIIIDREQTERVQVSFWNAMDYD